MCRCAVLRRWESRLNEDIFAKCYKIGRNMRHYCIDLMPGYNDVEFMIDFIGKLQVREHDLPPHYLQPFESLA